VATTFLLRTIKKIAFLAIPVTAVAGSVVAPAYAWTPAQGLLAGVTIPLVIALAIDELLLRRATLKEDHDS